MCSEAVCERPAAFKTKTRPAWCDEHITAILAAGGLAPLEPFTTPKAHRLTRCLTCGCEAHYRLEYTLDQNAQGVPTCRACYWRKWGAGQRRVLEGYADFSPVPEAEAKAHAERHGYEYLGPLTNPSLPHDPHRTRCVYCGRISAQRIGDIGWGCSCQTNPRRVRQTTSVSGSDKPGRKRQTKELLKDSKLPVIGWWDHESNDAALWDTVTVKARREVAWRCPECELQFVARVLDMTSMSACPDCSERRRVTWEAELAHWKVTPVAEVPELMQVWADEYDPRLVMVAEHTVRRFRCPEGHHPRITPLSFLRSGCPSCRGNATRRERLEQVKADPETHAMNREIASQWHYSMNAPLQLETISAGSRRTLWWKNWECGHEWQATPAEREKGQRLRCPTCRTILDSLAYHFPELGDEWSPENPVSAWQVRPTGHTPFTPKWVCSNNPDHSWTAPLASRAAGSGCPECRESGKSRIELDHHAATVRIFGQASSGQPVEHEGFVRRGRWLVDITTKTATGTPIAIEYDGSYWHADKADIDTAKTLDLLTAGYLVARLREHPLKPLPINNPLYAEFVVHAAAPDPEGVISRVRDWARTLES